MPSKSKVYEEVLKELRHFIEDQGLSPGDKLPSERELAERLRAGRSSVREALRAMELLGLIETRRGEGTFLSAYQPFQTVEILSAFILQEATTRENLKATKQLLEKEAAIMAMHQLTLEDFQLLQDEIDQFEPGIDTFHYAFFCVIFRVIENQLLMKIWKLMEDFSRTIHQPVYRIDIYKQIVEALRTRDEVYLERLCATLYK
ncbi:FadR/GntR family transcriptional regulator [Pontibacillus litoralis]|nr:GntR family transcriptional regulator [Pontibacillus litoralis]